MVDGDYAFPSDGDKEFNIPAEYGMTLRDYFAAKALATGLDPSALADTDNEEDFCLLIQNAAVLAYRIADAMMEARSAR